MRIISGASNGLSHLHSNGIIHSNVKASNVMIDGDFTPKASFHCKILASDWSTNENWNQLRHVENNHVEKNPDSENVRWWALELFYDSIVSFSYIYHFWQSLQIFRIRTLGRLRKKPIFGVLVFWCGRFSLWERRRIQILLPKISSIMWKWVSQGMTNVNSVSVRRSITGPCFLQTALPRLSTSSPSWILEALVEQGLFPSLSRRGRPSFREMKFEV